MELNALVGTPAAPNMPAEEGEGMAGVTGEEPFDTLDTFLRELQADLAEASQPTSTTTSVTPSCRRQRYNIAAANPLLAGKWEKIWEKYFEKNINYQNRPLPISFPIEKLAAPSSQASPTSIPYATRAEIKTESIQPETTKGKVHKFPRYSRTDFQISFAILSLYRETVTFYIKYLYYRQ